MMSSFPRTHGWSLDDRIALRTVVDPETGCYRWIGGKTSGYGMIAAELEGVKRLWRVHVLQWTRIHGPVPTGMELDHLCHTTECKKVADCPHRACHNVAHLQVVDRRENVLRGNAPSAQQARKTHCLRGHPLFGPNLHIDGLGRRICRECRAIHRRGYRAARRAREKDTRG